MTDEKTHPQPRVSKETGEDTVCLNEKIAFLRQPTAYPDRPTAVETVETHMSFVFLTERHAYKLKKPVRLDFLDYSTLELRHRDCQEEVRLNQRLAGDVYEDVVALTKDAHNRLCLEGSGTPVEWLVKMRRLPRVQMLDYAIAHERVSVNDVRRFSRRLAEYYLQAPKVSITPKTYWQRIEQAIAANHQALLDPNYTLSRSQVIGITDALLSFLHKAKDVFDKRVQEEHIIEAHGDLRPEHICLTEPPVFIDCLPFNQTFRQLDPVDELAFLAMECEYAGAPFIEDVMYETYREVTADEPSGSLVRFYKAHRAQLRAKLAVWHLRDCEVSQHGKWVQRANNYLKLAERYNSALER